MSSQEQQRVSVADLLASSVFHLLSRQCDPAMKPKNCLSISPFSNSNSVTRSFRSLSFISYQSSYIYYGKSQQLQTLFCTLQPFIPFHHFIIPKELLEFSSTSGLLHYIQVHIPDNSLKQMNTLC